MMIPRVTKLSCAPSLPSRAALTSSDSVTVWRSALSYPTPFASQGRFKRHQFVTLARRHQQQRELLRRNSSTVLVPEAGPSDHSHSDSNEGHRSRLSSSGAAPGSGGGRFWVPGTVLGVCAAALVLGTDSEARAEDAAAAQNDSETPNPHQKAARQLFMLYDTNGDGVLTIEEMREALARHHGWDQVADSDLHALFHVADTDGDNMLSLNEFVTALEQVKEVNTCFKQLDPKGSGVVDVNTVASFIADMVEDGSAALIVNNPAAAAQARRTDAEYLARLADTDKDGKLHLQEFCHLYLLLKKRKRFQEVSDVFSSVPMSQLGHGMFRTGVHHWSRIYHHMYLVDGLVPVYQVPSLVPRFLLGGTACGIATLFTSPMDVLKVRMQTANSASVPGLGKARMSQIAMEMAHKEGLASFWLGLQPAMHRAYLYSGFRLALYGPVKERLHGLVEPGSQHPSLLVKIAAGGFSGAFAAWASNPAEVVKNRLQAFPRAQQPSSVTAQILRTEGVRALFIAVYPNMLRGGVMTASQVATYDHIKHALLAGGYFSDGLALYFVSSMLAGVVTATAISPFDIVKTKIMSQDPTSPTRVSSWQCFREIVKEGPAGMFRGWLPQWGRLGPHTVITLMVFERIREALGISGI